VGGFTVYSHLVTLRHGFTLVIPRVFEIHRAVMDVHILCFCAPLVCGFLEESHHILAFQIIADDTSCKDWLDIFGVANEREERRAVAYPGAPW
jgi:hypothetical protein